MRPTPQQISTAIVAIHEALREAWPPGDEFVDAPVDWNTKLAWLGQWSKAREGWIATVQDAVGKLPLAPSGEEMGVWAGELISAFQGSAHDFRVGMMEVLD